MDKQMIMEVLYCLMEIFMFLLQNPGILEQLIILLRFLHIIK